MKLEFSQQILKKYSNVSNFMKIRPVGAKLFGAEEQMGRRTDKIRLIVTFHDFANTPDKKKKNSVFWT